MELSAYLFETLMSNCPDASPASGGKEILMQCRYCSDGKHSKSRHMYVGIGGNDEPPMFQCKICGSSGIVSNDTLIYWGVYNIDLGVALTQYNKRVLSIPKNMKYKDRDVYKLKNILVTPSKLSDFKLAYINDRLGQNLTFEDMFSLKIVLNLYDLFETNHIPELTRNVSVVNELDKSFIGFISQDNAFANMRNVRQGLVPAFMDKRYINYNIFAKTDNTQRFYVKPTNINLNNPERIKLHVSEGVFDILSVFLNLRKEDRHNIYAAAGGTGILNIIKYFIYRFKLTNIEIHIYADNDIDDYTFECISAILIPYGIPLYVHRNIFENEKDFGVPEQKIKEQIIRIA